MTLEHALASHDLWVILGTAAFLGCLHTLMGPDHYVPFIMMSRAERWSWPRTMWITFLCGLGHVGSSFVVGLGLGLVGMAASSWEDSVWAGWHEWRGAGSAWLLIGVGAAMTVHALVQHWRGKVHTHVHRHADGRLHVHAHAHDPAAEHAHVHLAEGPHSQDEPSDAPPTGSRLTPWILFTIFVFGPCESLIPLMLAATAVAGIPGSLLTALAFSVTTVATILAVVGVLLYGVERLSLGFLERHAQALAGVSLVLCGVAIRFLGL
jgi:ABC-type nickel/cobalt efflux system permease component RcnA